MKGLDCDERTVIFNPTVRRCLFTMFSGAKKQAKTFAVPSKPKVLDSIHLKATVKKLKKITTTDAIAITDVLEYILSLDEEEVPHCYLNLIYELSKNTPIFGLMQSTSRIFISSVKSYLDGTYLRTRRYWTI